VLQLALQLGPPGAIGEKFTVSQHGHEDVSHEQRPLYLGKQRVDPGNIRSMPLSESANSANFAAFYRNVSDAWRTAKEYPLDSLNYIIPRVEF
jgi:hypothetical protein